MREYTVGPDPVGPDPRIGPQDSGGPNPLGGSLLDDGPPVGRLSGWPGSTTRRQLQRLRSNQIVVANHYLVVPRTESDIL